MNAARCPCYVVAAFLLSAAALCPQTSPPPAQADPIELVRQGRRLSNQGKQNEALVLYRQALQMSPDLVEARVSAGIALDLLGQYEEARRHFSKAIETAKPEAKGQALRAMAMSYAFENNCQEAAKYESQLYDSYLAAKDFYNAGEMADELARVCIESGSLDDAYKWYQTGHDTGLREPGLKPDRKDLWDFRWEHAQARIAARRGKIGEAQKHIAAAKAILDKGANPDQLQFFPYLTGYVAFYAGDYKTALADLQKANQRDPFIQVLLGQVYEKSGGQAQAVECYRKALGSNAHNPPNAVARPIAKKKLG